MTWTRSDLKEYGLGCGLISYEARVCLTMGYTVTGPDGRTRTKLSDAAMREWFQERGLTAPSTDDLEWLNANN